MKWSWKEAQMVDFHIEEEISCHYEITHFEQCEVINPPDKAQPKLSENDGDLLAITVCGVRIERFRPHAETQAALASLFAALEQVTKDKVAEWYPEEEGDE